MKQDMIVILDLGSDENPRLAREIRALGVYSEIHPHDITLQQLQALPNVKGVILNGGVNRVVDGVSIDIKQEIYDCGLPVHLADHKGAPAWPADEAARKQAISDFIFGVCHAEANWNMENFIADQIDLIREQVGDKKVLLALSGGVDSSVVAALLIQAIGKQLTCVHVNHGLLRKGERSRSSTSSATTWTRTLFTSTLSTVSWICWRASATRRKSVKSSAANLYGSLQKRPANSTVSNSWRKARSIRIFSSPARRRSRRQVASQRRRSARKPAFRPCRTA